MTCPDCTAAAPGTPVVRASAADVPKARAPSGALEHPVEHGCPECSTAAQREHWQFREGCPGCIARGIGRLRIYPGASQHTRAYRELLRGAGVDHAAVREARALDALHRESAHR